ncbi:hypothetical protein [Algirhabdus cladophorae]|uniref:hypothetical protein n=1 Tax=Algirhabdus cladophorae TaxID=3377108 RepID=UPI003B847C9D
MKKRKSKRSKTKQPVQSTQTAQSSNHGPNRRQMLRWLRNGVVALPILGGAGYFSIQSVEATICEADLTKIGRGTPSIVQIHDPNCQLCATLQRQSRRALRAFEDDSYEFLVANLNTTEGRTLAAVHRVSHVTLLLFNGDGQMVRIVRGPTDMDTLDRVFRSHIGNPEEV